MVKTFVSSRITSGNLLFRDKLIVDLTQNTISFKKRNPIGIGFQKIIFRFIDITSFEVQKREEWLFYCTLIFENRGGQRIVANGFTIKDARYICNLLGFGLI